jgi:hypothetical protein
MFHPLVLGTLPRPCRLLCILHGRHGIARDDELGFHEKK